MGNSMNSATGEYYDNNGQLRSAAEYEAAMLQNLRDLYLLSDDDEEEEEEGGVGGKIKGGEAGLPQARVDEFMRVVYNGDIEALDRDACTICLEARRAGDLVVVLPCRHRYHDHCCRQLFRTSKLCAVCRTSYG